MSPASGTAPPHAAKPRHTRYTPLWVEALAYHEAGHAMMAVALGIPVARVAIAEECDLADSNGLVEYAGDMAGVTPLKHALCLLASGPAEDLAPNRAAFKTLRGFATGRRNDARLAFLAMSAPYLILRLAESTARREFRWTTAPLVDDVMDQPENRAVVREMAAILTASKAMDAAAVAAFRGRTVLPDEVARVVVNQGLTLAGHRGCPGGEEEADRSDVPVLPEPDPAREAEGPRRGRRQIEGNDPRGGGSRRGSLSTAERFGLE